MSARWISRDVVRATWRRSPSSSASASVPPELARRGRAARGCAPSPRRGRSARARVQREPEHAELSTCRMTEERHRHREVLVDARERHRLREEVSGRAAASARAAARRRRSGSRCRRASRAPASSSSPAARAACSASRSERGCCPYGIVGGVDDLLRRHEVEEARAGRSRSRRRCRRRRPPCRRSGLPSAARGRRCRRAR